MPRDPHDLDRPVQVMDGTITPTRSTPIGGMPSLRRWRGSTLRTALIAAAAAVIVAGIGFGANAAFLVGDPVQQVQSAPDVQQRSLPATGGGTVTVLWSPAEQRAALVTDSLPLLTGGQVYQAWFVQGQNATSAGVFSPDASGAHVGALDGRVPTGASVTVTLEPVGGSTGPTANPIVIISLT